MAYSPDNTTVFWTEDGTNKVRSSGLSTGTATDIVTTGLTRPHGIAVETSGSKLYYSDHGGDTLKSVFIDGTGEATLASNLGDPRGVAVDSGNNKVYWCDDLNNTITRADLDGSNPTVIVTDTNAVGIALDLTNDKMYWSENDESGSLRRADLDGSNAEYLTSEGGSLESTITALGSGLFHTDGVDVYEPRAIKMSDNVHVVVYAYGPFGPSDVFCRVIQFDGSTMTSGEAVVLRTGKGYPGYYNGINIQRISDDQFFVVYGQDGPLDTELDIVSLTGTLSANVESTTQIDGQFFYEMYPTEMVAQTPTSSGIYMLTGKGLADNKCWIRALAISGSVVQTGVNVKIDDQVHSRYLGVSPIGVGGSGFALFCSLPITGVNKTIHYYGTINGLTTTLRGSGIVGDGGGTQYLMEVTNCEALGDGRVAMMGEISGDDDRIFIYSVDGTELAETPPDGIGLQHSDDHAFAVMDSSTIAFCTYETGVTRLQICKVTETSGIIGDILAADDAIDLHIAKVNDNTFALYTANAVEDKGEVETYTIAGGTISTSGSIRFPQAVALDVAQNSLYWAGDGAEVSRIDMAGSNSGVLIPTSEGFTGISGLAVDVDNQQFYFTDATAGTISRSDVDGTNIETLASDLSSPYGIAVVATDGLENNRISLYMRGVTVAVQASGEPTRIINHLTKTSDYDPQLVNIFSVTPTGVNIEVWDIVDGQNTKLAIANSGCYAIGDTGYWGWSTAHLSFTSEHKRSHYYYRMTSNEGEQEYGEFLMDTPEKGVWSHPD